MRARWQYRSALGCLAVLLLVLPAAADETLAELQARFDRETNAVRKAKLIEKLGDVQFDEARRAGKTGDNSALDFTLEKYRDNVRAALDALRKQQPDAERHSNGYRQLQFHVHRGIREVQESILMAPDPYKPPLEIVRHDLIAINEELIKLLFPLHPEKPATTPPQPEKKP